MLLNCGKITVNSNFGGNYYDNFKGKSFRAVLSEKRTTFLFEQVLRYHFSSLGKIEEYMTSKDITEEGKRLVMFAFII